MMDSKTKVTLALILLSSTFTVMAGAIIGPVVNLIRESFGVSQSMAGLIVTTHGLFIAGLSPVWGLIIDKVGSKKPYVFGLILYGAAGGTGLFINSYWLLIVSRAIFGIAVAAVYTSITVMILNLYSRKERNKVMGWRGSSNSLSAAVWPLIGGSLGVFSWHLPFGIYLLALPLGFLAFFFVPSVNSYDRGFGGGKVSIWSVFSDKPVLFAVYGFMFLTNFFLYTNVVYIPRLLETFEVANPFYISLFLAAMGVSGGIMAAFYYKVKSCFEYRKIVLISLLFWTAAFTLAKFASNVFFVGLSVILYGIGQGLALPTAMVWVGDVVSSRFYGRVGSYLGTFGYLGQFSAPIIFASALLFVKIEDIFLTSAILSSILLIVGFIKVRIS
ncbi:MAG: MFS transporter [Candidatus Thermoplasmatota archaeon]